MRYNKPRLAFKRDVWNPLILHYANAYYPGCFTPTGLPYDNDDFPKMLEWIKDHNCGKESDVAAEPYTLIFENEEQVTWFLLNWG